MTSSDAKKVAIFISGGGSTAIAVCKAMRRTVIPNLQCSLVIGSKDTANVGGVCAAAGLDPSQGIILRRKDFADQTSYDTTILKLLSEQGIEILAMLGYIPVMSDPVISAYKGRIFNQHGGGLDPARNSPDGTRRDFGGRGMMGMATHAAMFYYGQEYMRVFERPAIYLEVSSHHVVPGEIDSGDLIETGSVELTQSDTLGPWHDRVIAAEHALQISVLRTLGMTGSLPTIQRHKPLIPDKAVQLLADARARAIREFPKG